MDIDPVARRLRDALVGDARIVAAYLFGSAAKGVSRPESDVDVAVLLAGRPSGADAFALRLELADRLSRILGREADVVILDTAPLALRYSVYRANRPLFERERGAAHLFQAESLSRWFDFEPAHARCCREAAAALAERGARA